MRRTVSTCSAVVWTGKGARERSQIVSFGCGGASGFLDEEGIGCSDRCGFVASARESGGACGRRKSSSLPGVSAAAAGNRYAVHRSTTPLDGVVALFCHSTTAKEWQR